MHTVRPRLMLNRHCHRNTPLMPCGYFTAKAESRMRKGILDFLCETLRRCDLAVKFRKHSVQMIFTCATDLLL
jgi:hypothetical protein